jgi:hypothetical protein
MPKIPVRKLTIVGDVAIVPLTQGFFAIIDASDAEKVGQHNWCAAKCSGKFYAYRCRKVGENYASKMIAMHRYILGVVGRDHVDHVNSDTLDNRRANIRPATRSENMMNVGLCSRNSSGFKGVSWNKSVEKWQAQIIAKGKWHNLGLHLTKEDAAQAYEKAAERLHGKFARTR